MVEGIGAGGKVADVVVTVVEVVIAWVFFSERVEYIAAVTPAPVAALTAAMIASVDFDIVKEEPVGRGRLGCIYLETKR